MVNVLLKITAELENLTELQPQGGCDDPNFPYYLQMQCMSCGEKSPKETCVILSETVPLSTGRGITNLNQKNQNPIDDSRHFSPTKIYPAEIRAF